MKKKMAEVKTLRQYVTAHRRLWDWLAKNPMKDKEEWPGWDFNGGTYEYIFCYCFMCGVTVKLRKFLVSDGDVGISRCKFCPLEWGGLTCESTVSPYWRYGKSKFRLDKLSRNTQHTEQELDLAVRDVQLNAMAVRDLPLKKGIWVYAMMYLIKAKEVERDI